MLDLCFSSSSSSAEYSGTIDDALVIGQPINDGSDERVVLFVQLPVGQTLDDELVKRVKHEIRTRRSARHVPARVSLFSYLVSGGGSIDVAIHYQILQVKEIPHTLNGKPVEVPVKKVRNPCLTVLRVPQILTDTLFNLTGSSSLLARHNPVSTQAPSATLTALTSMSR